MSGLSPLKRLDWLGDMAKNPLVTGAQIRIAIALCGHQNVETGRLNPSVTRLATETGISERAVRKSIKQLECFGYLGVNRKNSGGRSKTNSYFLVFQTSETPTPETGNRETRNDSSLNSGSVNPEPQFRKTLNHSSPEQGNRTRERTSNSKNGQIFEKFWSCWPKGFGSKGSKANAEKIWNRDNLDLLADTINQAVQKQATQKTNEKQSTGFTANFKHVERWLKGREWENEIDDDQSDSLSWMEGVL